LTGADEVASEDLRGLQSIPRGFLRLLIVRLLQDHEMSGADIMQVLEKRSQRRWRPSPGSLYPMLASLRDEGLIEIVRTEGRTSTYRLSSKGEERVKEVFRHKDKVENSTGLHRLIWLELLDPNDRVHFHMNAVAIGSEALLEYVDQLTQTQRQRLIGRVEKTIDTLGQLLDRLKIGNMDYGRSSNNDD
jgi:DNA-binding PadR family transcriptional regulator